MLKINILIAEDDIVVQNFLTDVIRKAEPSCNILMAVSENEAWNIAQENSIHLFIIDNGLKDSSGYVLSKRIRKLQKYAYTPIIFETIDPEPIVEYAAEFRYVGYFVKPLSNIEVEKLLKAVFNIINKAPAASLEIRSKNGIETVEFYEIIYIAAAYKGTKIFTKQKVLHSHDYLKDILEKLDGRFSQCHKSFIVNYFCIDEFDINMEYVTLSDVKTKIPIGRTFKSEFKINFNNAR